MPGWAVIFVENTCPWFCITHHSYIFSLYRCSSLVENYKATISKLFHNFGTSLWVSSVQILPGLFKVTHPQGKAGNVQPKGMKQEC